MQVFQFIYTKVPRQESPFSEVDFHTVFYPIELLRKEDLHSIERKIHFPQNSEFKEKKTVFYQKIKDKDYLIIIEMRNLPEARDTFGRGGIFICHGFIFPEEIWKRFSMPLTSFELVKKDLFTKIEDVLSSTLVDKKSGNIQAINITERDLNDISDRIQALSSEFELKIALMLNCLATMDEKEKFSLLLNGKPEEISEFLNRIFAYIPDELKVKVGWDSCLDGGNILFYPLKIVGYDQNAPIGGSQIRIDISTSSLKADEEIKELFIPQTAYQRWLYHCYKEAISKEHIEKAYKLSSFLEGKTKISSPDEILAQRSCFASNNREVIEKKFHNQLAKEIGETITKYIINNLNPETMLNIIIEGFPPAKLSYYIEEVILKNRITLQDIKTPLPFYLIEAGSERLKLIDKLWKGEILKFNDLIQLDKKVKLEFIKYLLNAGYKEKDWLLDILKEDKEVFDMLFNFYETKKIIEDIFLDIILKEKEFKQIAKFLKIQIINQGKGFQLLKKDVNFVEVIEEALKGEIANNEIKKLIQWAKKRKAPNNKFQYIRTFLYPKEGISKDVLNNERAKQKLITWLIDHHKYKAPEIQKLGLDKDTLLKIEEGIKKEGLIHKIKRFLKIKNKKERRKKGEWT